MRQDYSREDLLDIQHMNAGMTVVEACREVGIARSSFYYIIENNPEVIAEFQVIIDASNG